MLLLPSSRPVPQHAVRPHTPSRSLRPTSCQIQLQRLQQLQVPQTIARSSTRWSMGILAIPSPKLTMFPPSAYSSGILSLSNVSTSLQPAARSVYHHHVRFTESRRIILVLVSLLSTHRNVQCGSCVLRISISTTSVRTSTT